MSESLKLVAGDNRERRREATTLVWNGTPVHRILKFTVLPEMGVVKSDCWMLFSGDGGVRGQFESILGIPSNEG
ncbi:hypothetical protein H5410_034403 [Solanum commersonii]|uniref:Uncharacterized protein n=1 Tax=Solanum commersonii TaxID=4109 RepID=A0A9J5YRA9_SOLCO|nr:hypothetical protein H5410_034403 [Solanum commersonii]